MRESRTFSIRLSGGEGKLGLAELCGESSAREKDSLGINLNVSSIRTTLDHKDYLDLLFMKEKFEK